MPIFAILASIGASAAGGGLVFINVARRPKNVAALIFATCSTGGVFTSKFGSTTPGGALYGLPNADSGTSLNWSWIACTAA